MSTFNHRIKHDGSDFVVVDNQNPRLPSTSGGGKKYITIEDDTTSCLINI